MKVMLANNTGERVLGLAKRFPDRLAHLISPGGWREPRLPYALDNGAFPAWQNRVEWDPGIFEALLNKANGCEAKPLWVVVPDAVGDKRATLDKWKEWEPKLRPLGWPLAFAVQDGMTDRDVPKGVDVILVGGTVEWKWLTVHEWALAFTRVHVARVNTGEGLWRCRDLNVESVDGTGWLRGGDDRIHQLEGFLDRDSRGLGPQQARLFTND